MKRLQPRASESMRLGSDIQRKACSLMDSGPGIARTNGTVSGIRSRVSPDHRDWSCFC
jgi:hypothetical protein